MKVMSAIMETEPGGEMVCILAFSARPRGEDGQPISGERRRFHVGQRVRFFSFFFKSTPQDNPSGYMAVFEPLDPSDKNRYAATETYFVTLDCWEDLGRYFARNRAKRAKRRAPSVERQTEASDAGAAKASKSPRAAAKLSATARITARPLATEPERKSGHGKRFRKHP
jgi:hypothetical protein